ncbi:MAG: sugar ABC transporter permease [Rhodobacterales bacterium]|nr:sugar ABC transporter permease [Rhodobacterales bacterium]
MSYSPPKSLGPLARRQARLAWFLLLPTILSVVLVIILPLMAIFWISFKPIALEDLRPASAMVREQLKGKPKQPGDAAIIRYKIRNSSQKDPIFGVTIADEIPTSLEVITVDKRCSLKERNLNCSLGEFGGGQRETLEISVIAKQEFFDKRIKLTDSVVKVTGRGENVLTNSEFTLKNFAYIFDSSEFWTVIYATLFYTVFGTIGALVVGLFAALLLNIDFRGKGLIRGLYLFPYVAPVIAVAFAWVILFDPFSGSINALLVQMEIVETPINFFGQKPYALIMVTVFEIWRYFPLSFLFILARMQAIDVEMYEAADMDGASPFQIFWYLSLPTLMGILSILFLLRFIWTFNKFDDIFLLTGGSADTRTLTVNVYEQAFAVSNIGAGSAVAVVIFVFLLFFSIFFFRYLNREEGL